jgi:hypothetical protein
MIEIYYRYDFNLSLNIPYVLKFRVVNRTRYCAAITIF